MADTTEIKKVITIDAGNSIQTLSDYKTKIDTLKNSLDNLDESSDEYAKTIKEIDDLQNELNSVVDEGSDSLDSLGSSYENLSSKAGKFKNNLKDIGDSTENLHSNISDYSGAFETAFDKMLDGVESVDGPIGEVGGTVKNMIPVIKSVNSTAVSGLKGVKKAIASTGIGLLVVAVATLVTHWEDFTKVVGISQEKISEFKERAIETLKNIVSGTVGVGNAIGTFLLAPIRATIEAFKGLGNIVKDVFTGDFSKVKEDAQAAFDAINGIGKQAIDFKQNYAAGKEAADNLIVTINERLTSKDNIDKAEESGKTIGKATTKGITEGVKEETGNSQKAISDLWSTMFKTALANGLKELSEEAKRRKGWLSEAMQEAEDEASQEKFELQYSADYDTMTEQERADAEYEIERGLIEKKIELQQTYLDNFIGTQEEKEVELKKLSKLQRELENEDLKHTVETEDRKAAKKKQEQQNLLSSSINLFGALSDLAEEGSEEQKAFSIMQTVLNTLQSIMGIWAGYSEMGPFGVAAAAVQTAAVTAMGAATIAKMKSTTKESSSSASVAAPQIPTPSMTSVTPLLDEQSDLNRLETSGVQGESANGTTNMRVYVVDQDIRDANHRAEVVEDNATF
jgi:HAMP domain-containing protein